MSPAYLMSVSDVRALAEALADGLAERGLIAAAASASPTRLLVEARPKDPGRARSHE